MGDAVVGVQHAQVAGERVGVARDIHQRARSETQQQRAGLHAGTGAGRVEHDELGAVALQHGGAQEVEHVGCNGGVLWLSLIHI